MSAFFCDPPSTDEPSLRMVYRYPSSPTLMTAECGQSTTSRNSWTNPLLHPHSCGYAIALRMAEERNTDHSQTCGSTQSDKDWADLFWSKNAVQNLWGVITRKILDYPGACDVEERSFLETLASMNESQ